jgi:Amidohydrolase family
VPIAFGTDLWGLDAQKSQLRKFEMRSGLDTAARIIRSATAVNAELLMQQGKLGTIAAGACADLLVVEGDPLADLGAMLDPRRNLKPIMKDGARFACLPDRQRDEGFFSPLTGLGLLRLPTATLSRSGALPPPSSAPARSPTPGFRESFA